MFYHILSANKKLEYKNYGIMEYKKQAGKLLTKNATCHVSVLF